ncbi:YceI family protein [Salinibacterium hongtaonis]|uniref:YceI family protein n=1 Tax=Homoserinimonas hongtaonis TaxID=2079791 RepID=UPI000D354F67|nr:YceI family protein [Salinibacterium hongtaonis]AWB89081.1 YceI family protein [Salinibacterium hongtaonis]
MSLSKRTISVIVGGAIVVALGVTTAIAGPAIYRDLIVGPADDAPSLEAESLAPGTIDEDALAGEWTVSDGSFAGYRVDEVLNGTDVTVTGRTEDVTGTVTTTDTEVTAASITVDVASIATDSGSRDAYFRDTAMRVSVHPTATFELTTPIGGGGAPLDTTATVSGTGVLTLAGVSNEVTVEMTAAIDGGTIRVAGQIPVTFSDYGVTAPSLGFVQVEETGFVEFLLVLSPGPRT